MKFLRQLATIWDRLNFCQGLQIRLTPILCRYYRTLPPSTWLTCISTFSGNRQERRMTRPISTAWTQLISPLNHNKSHWIDNSCPSTQQMNHQARPEIQNDPKKLINWNRFSHSKELSEGLTTIPIDIYPFYSFWFRFSFYFTWSNRIEMTIN